MSLTGEDFLFAGVVVVFIAAVFIARRFSGVPLPLRQWAEEQDCKIVRAIYREFAHGPFEARARRVGQDFYQIWVRTSEGRERRAWALCDFSGACEPVVVVWDEQPRPHDEIIRKEGISRVRFCSARCCAAMAGTLPFA